MDAYFDQVNCPRRRILSEFVRDNHLSPKIRVSIRQCLSLNILMENGKKFKTIAEAEPGTWDRLSSKTLNRKHLLNVDTVIKMFVRRVVEGEEVPDISD